MAYPRQPCDSFFVESQDARHDPRATQEYIKMMGRRKQEAMANTLSAQAADSYLSDIVEHMMQMEVIALITSTSTSC